MSKELKRFLVVVGVILLFAFLAIRANASTERMSGDWPLSKDFIIYNTTVTSSVYSTPLTIAAGAVVSINLRARGGDIYWSKDSPVAGAYFTIGQNQTYYDHLPMPFEKNKVLYFFTDGSPYTLEALVNYR